MSTSVGGTLTGRGGDIIILDDVIKPEEAHSETTRNAVNDWYRSTLASRLNDKETGAIICVMQRLHQYDLPGMLLDAGTWDHFALPAIAVEDEIIPLKHSAIVDKALFEEVKQQLDRQARRHRSRGEQTAARAPLTGRLFDAQGEVMSPAFSKGQNGRLYRYYVSASLQQGGRPQADAVRRLPAPNFERLVTELVERWLPSEAKPLDLPHSVRISERGLLIDLPGRLLADAAARLSEGERIVHSTRQFCRIEVPLALPLRGGQRLIVTGTRTSKPDRTLIAALRKAHHMVLLSRGQPVLETAPASRHERDLLRLAFLAPDLQRDILAGYQPPTLNLEALRRIDIPLCWKQQRRVLGWRGQS